LGNSPARPDPISSISLYPCNNAHYYCGKDNKYFDDPEDDPHMPPPLEPEPQRPDDPDGGLHDS
jgi:hypothetical protein